METCSGRMISKTPSLRITVPTRLRNSRIPYTYHPNSSTRLSRSRSRMVRPKCASTSRQSRRRHSTSSTRGLRHGRSQADHLSRRLVLHRQSSLLLLLPLVLLLHHPHSRRSPLPSNPVAATTSRTIWVPTVPIQPQQTGSCKIRKVVSRQ